MDKEYGIELNLDLSKLSKQIAKAKNMVKDVEGTFREIKVTGLDSVKEIKFDTSKVQEVKKNLEEVANVKDRIANGSIKITGLEDIPGALSEAEYEAQKLRKELEMQNKIDVDTSGISKFRQKTEEEMNATKSSVQDKMDAIADNIKSKFYSASSSTKTAINDIVKSFSKINLKKFTSELSNVSSKFKTIKKESSDLGQNIKKTFNKGISGLKRFALSLFGIQSAYRAVTRAVSAYLSYDQELQKTLQNTWAGLGSFLAPVLEYLVGAFQKLLAYINAVVQALTGINFVARANQKALDKMASSAGSTAKAMKQLGGFDELNNINPDTGGGASGGGSETSPIELPEVDTTKIEGFVAKVETIISKVQNKLSTFFEPVQKAWETSGPSLISSVETTFGKIGSLAGTIGQSVEEVWTNGTGQQYVENILGLWTSVSNTIGNIAEALEKAWEKNNNGTKTIQHIFDIFNDISGLAEDISKTLEEWTTSKEFQEMMNTLVYLMERISYYAEKVIKWVREKYNEWIKPVLGDLLKLLSSVITMIGKIWEKAEPVVKKVAGIFKDTLETRIKGVISRVETFIQRIQGIVDIVTGALAGNWTQVWNGMKKTAKAVINTIIDGINGLTGGLNTIAAPLRLVITGISKAVGKKVSYKDVKIPAIPKLKVGTDDVYSEGLAYLHAGEKVVPADVAKGGYTGSDNEETNNLLRQLIELIDDKDFNPYVTVEDIGKASVNYINKKKRITGEAII